MRLVSIVIPVFNSADSIGELVDNLVTEIGDNYSLEIALVNDHSLDNSEEVCIASHNKHNKVVSYYSLSKNVGEHNAVMAGLNNVSGEYVVVMDDDFQNPISEVVKLINYASKSNYDVVYTYYEKKQHSFIRNLLSRLNDKCANVMLDKPKDLYLSSFKIINKRVVSEIIKYSLPFPYVDGLILGTTDNIGKIKLEHDGRRVGKSNYTVRKLLAIWLNMFTSFSIVPLRISVMLGFIFSIAGLILGVQAVVWKITDPTMPLGYTSLIVFLSIFSGVHLLAIGMLGEYLGRMFLSLNGKPQYLISRKVLKVENVYDESRR